ncbi:hypothetical protein B6U90_06530 [Thermoplasmatales archaeon ex4484_6]|nr:MAG: hypothetical protein B6U90_06530 [Thermoplasmatales archaeon ex4484_6]
MVFLMLALSACMPRFFHEIRMDAFVQATEDEEKVLRALVSLCGGIEAGGIERMETEGVHSNPIIILRVRVRKEREIRELLERWKGMKFWRESFNDVEDRLDGDLVFHVRVDKSSCLEGEPSLWKSGEAIDIRLKIAAYPASRDRARSTLMEHAAPDR